MPWNSLLVHSQPLPSVSDTPHALSLTGADPTGNGAHCFRVRCTERSLFGRAPAPAASHSASVGSRPAVPPPPPAAGGYSQAQYAAASDKLTLTGQRAASPNGTEPSTVRTKRSPSPSASAPALDREEAAAAFRPGLGLNLCFLRGRGGDERPYERTQEAVEALQVKFRHLRGRIFYPRLRRRKS